MCFPGSFSEHILHEHTERLSLSFLVDQMERRQGGCAPNIAYTLALLGERPRVMGAAGRDFDEYREWLESIGVDTSLIYVNPHKFTASFFCNTDRHNNQIASFYSGAMADARNLSFYELDFKPDLVIISPNDPIAMQRYAAECRELDITFIYDPGQQVARSSGEELKEGLRGAQMLICNDYEFQIIRQKTQLGVQELLEEVELLVITRGAAGSQIITRHEVIDIPAVPEKHIADPTGVGDAFRAGFLKGLAVGAPLDVCGKLGSVAATYALEHVGGQGHYFKWEDFKQRYEAHFGPLSL